MLSEAEEIPSFFPYVNSGVVVHSSKHFIQLALIGSERGLDERAKPLELVVDQRSW